jgi:membrane fusion protein
MLVTIVLGSYTRRENLRGMLTPASGLVDVFAPQNGAIRSIAVTDGQTVHTGDLLYVIDTDTTSRDGATQERILASLRHQRDLLNAQIATKEQLRSAQDRDLQDKAANLRSQVDQDAVQISVQSAFTDVLQRQYNDFSSYVSKGISSNNELQVRQQAWMQAKNTLEGLRNQKLRSEAELTDVEYQLRTNDPRTDSEIGTMHSQILDIDQKIANSEANRSVEIRAPGDGTVTAIMAYAGQTIATNTPLLKIVPNTELTAELLAPSSAVGFIVPGERVLLRYNAFPYQKFGQYWGTVAGVSQAALSDEQVKSLPIEAQKATYYRVIVRPDSAYVNVYGHERPLRASMQVDAYVLLDRRPLYEWILEPLYSLRRGLVTGTS